MVRRAVQRKPYDWESLLAPVLQAYRSSVSEATGFTPYRLAFGREMRLPVDLGTPLPKPPRDVRTLAAELECRPLRLYGAGRLRLLPPV